jgi:hypothetical protein
MFRFSPRDFRRGRKWREGGRRLAAQFELCWWRRVDLWCSAQWGLIMFDEWLKFASDSTMLAIEAQGVIGMRLSQIALGRGSADETSLMVTEKLSALTDAAKTILTGGSAHMIVADYRERVQANAQRLRAD